MATIYYRDRRSPGPESRASTGDVVRLRENAGYALRFSEPLSSLERAELSAFGFEILDDTRVLATFRNFIGTMMLRGIKFQVISRKIGEFGSARLLEEAVQIAGEIIYGWRAPLAFQVSRQGRSNTHVPFHDFMYLRHEMLIAKVGERMQDYFQAVLERPTRRLDATHQWIPSARARTMDRKSWSSMAAEPAKLAKLHSQHALFEKGIPAALTHKGATDDERFMPLEVRVPVPVVSFDTPENRFVKHLLQLCEGIVGRFLEHPKLHNRLREEARLMAVNVQNMARAPFLEGVGFPGGLVAPSQATLKLEGYRQLFELYRTLLDASLLPQSDAEAQRFLDGKDVATLYEYWVFLKVAQSVGSLCGEKVELRVDANEFNVLLPNGLAVTFPGDIKVHYNRTYPGASAMGSYSTSLRPDVVLEVGSRHFVFDAKYRLDGIPMADDEGDESGDDRSLLWKKADHYKMHSYRDAIQSVSAALVIYPGDTFMFFDKSGKRYSNPDAIQLFDGVGAIPLRPGHPSGTTDLDTVVKTLLSASSSSL